MNEYYIAGGFFLTIFGRNAGPGKHAVYVQYLTYSWKQPLDISNQEHPHFTDEATEIQRG